MKQTTKELLMSICFVIVFILITISGFYYLGINELKVGIPVAVIGMIGLVMCLLWFFQSYSKLNEC